MDIIKNLSLKEAATRMGLPDREVIRLAERGEVTRIKKNGDYVYRVKVGQTKPQPPPAQNDQGHISEQDNHGFIVLRQAHQSATALVRQLEQDKNGLKEQLEHLATQSQRRLFHWKSSLVACVMTVLLLGSALVIGWTLYQGQGRDILEAQRTLAVTTDHLEYKIESARQHSQQLQHQLDQAQISHQHAQKQIESERNKLDQANARIEKLSQAVLDIIKKPE